MRKTDETKDKHLGTRDARAEEKRSGEGAASALARLRSLERAKALERSGKKPAIVW